MSCPKHYEQGADLSLRSFLYILLARSDGGNFNGRYRDGKQNHLFAFPASHCGANIPVATGENH